MLTQFSIAQATIGHNLFNSLVNISEFFLNSTNIDLNIRYAENALRNIDEIQNRNDNINRNNDINRN